MSLTYQLPPAELDDASSQRPRFMASSADSLSRAIARPAEKHETEKHQAEKHEVEKHEAGVDA